MKNMEIERKWLIDAFPNLPTESEAEMEQAYLSFEPSTVRIRKVASGGKTSCFLTIKGGGTLQRTEVELPMQPAQYNALAPLAIVPPVHKKYKTYRLPGGYKLECNLVDESQPTAFYYAEVEFDSVEQARKFIPPAFLGREVTEEPGFTMAAYSRRKAGAK